MPTLPEISLLCETDRFGPFRFRIGLDADDLTVPLIRAEDAHRSFAASPLAQVANRLEREVLVQSVHGTNTIEGAELSEEETADALSLAPEQVHAEQQARVRNIKAAYDLALRRATDPKWSLDLAFIKAVHAEICRDLGDGDNQPGRLRDNPKDKITYVGDAAHGGRYKPPQFGRDIERLLVGLLEWHGQLVAADIPALIRAPLVHLYFERIHPFWDGNGRVGRVLEATLLRQAGFRYAPFALSRYYLEQIHAYFTLFNTARKADEAGRPFPNQGFIRMHLEGMRLTIDRLHARVNKMVEALLFDARLSSLKDAGTINARQYTIARFVLDRGRPTGYDELRRSPWYMTLYSKKTDKTRQRDMRGLTTLGLLRVDADGMVRSGFVAAP